LEGGDRGRPVDDGHGPAVGQAASDGDESAGEVSSVQPGLSDEQLGCGFGAVQAVGVGAQRRGQPGR